MSHLSLRIKHLFIQFLHLSTCILGTRPCLNLPSVKASKRPLLISNITTSFPIADTATNATTTHESVELSTSQFLGRDSFPPGFIFGAGSSAYQTEGAWNKGGRGPSIWDTFCHDHPEKIADGSNGDVAVESYYRYKEDVKLLKDMNMDAFRFSISWSRILPNGSLNGGINQEGINYYNNLIDELLSNGITPYVTLFHWDLPQGLQDHGGFANRQTVSDFVDYSNLCFQKFGDKVKYWITVNEPYHYSTNGHAHGDVAPGRCTPIFGCSEGNSIYEPYIVSHNLILAHGEAVRLYREKYQATQGGQIGIVLDCFWYEPYNNMHQHRDAANRVLDFNFGWYMDPLVYGDYPFIMKAIVRDRLPTFTQEESKMITKSFDFIGLNYYTARYAKSKAFSPENYPLKATDDTYAEELVSNGHSDIGIWSNGAWIEVYPKGIKEILLRIKDIYGNPPIYVSENGYADLVTTRLTKEEEIADKVRIKYFELHLPEVKDVIKAGADVRGYFAWSLTDNFEWLSGYTLRFGLHYVDYDTMERTPKDSAKWFSRILKKK